MGDPTTEVDKSNCLHHVLSSFRSARATVISAQDRIPAGTVSRSITFQACDIRWRRLVHRPCAVSLTQLTRAKSCSLKLKRLAVPVFTRLKIRLFACFDPGSGALLRDCPLSRRRGTSFIEEMPHPRSFSRRPVFEMLLFQPASDWRDR